MRQAFAGLLWRKQFYHYDVKRWLDGDPPSRRRRAERRRGRNHEWPHLYNDDVISMPDKWEYPWYAAWDLAFHMHPARAGRPRVRQGAAHPAAARVVHAPERADPRLRVGVRRREPAGARVGRVARLQDRRRSAAGVADREFLERVFHKLLLNFTWWVNRKDAEGNNVFQGGFLGPRQHRRLRPVARRCRRAGTSSSPTAPRWMAMYCLNMLAIALELAQDDRAYEDVATKFFEHFVYIAHAMNDLGGERHHALGRGGRLLLRRAAPADGERRCPLKVRSMVGLIPLFAVETLEPEIARPAARTSSGACSGSSTTARSSPTTSSTCSGPGGGDAAPALDRDPAQLRARARATCSTRRVPLALRHPRAVALPPRASVPRCTSTGIEHRVDYEPAESTHRALRRQLELARARSGSR